ncbi:GNAT family N-acetyltransferase [Dyadobacter chenwenxiniae]|uniref:GNAT family N-acetyltransferase n=1 Tax=Dyadobacter chenwenxiniae TaxID=2906456 RepID=A0A9X1PIE6_9BACT|nr:GNAT family N-acetyltransferase [Dyadobacter chenwenxiniae]MCF0060524.1 GNAT family N-acetyltransferase [Dyadobacter chenwenxiniae]UON86255.1 GNAT family N-acetyltransferase [Dyadobacter chenwenxiniae]
MFYIESMRLRLIPLTHQLLQQYHTSRPEMESALGLNHSEIKIDPLYVTEIEDALVNFWLPKTLAFPERYQWFTSWEIVLKSDNISVGGIGFNGLPNEKKEAEIGYMIYENQQGKGYATEALQAMANWAFTHEEVETVVVQTAADNIPSRKILDKNGFVLAGESENILTYKLVRS